MIAPMRTILLRRAVLLLVLLVALLFVSSAVASPGHGGRAGSLIIAG
jgi:hypothetical protein